MIRRYSTRLDNSWTKPYYPYYFFLAEDVPKEYLRAVGAAKEGQPQLYDLVLGDRRAEAAVSHYIDGDLSGLVNIEFSAADAWFEEDEQIYQHPKDPYKVSHQWPFSEQAQLDV